MQDLFIELFPILLDQIPDLAVYKVIFDADKYAGAGDELAQRLNRTFPGFWVWFDGRLITDEPISPIQLDITIDILKSEAPELFSHIVSVEEDARWKNSAYNIARFILWARIPLLEDQLKQALDKMNVSIDNARIERKYSLQAWSVNNTPALSITIHSQMIYTHNLQVYAEKLENSKEILGLEVLDKTSAIRGTIKSISGKLSKRRNNLLKSTEREIMQTIIQNAPDDELAVHVEVGKITHEYPASALNILIRPTIPDDLERFKINPNRAQQGMNLRPDTRAQLVKVLSDILKAQGIIDNAYNSRTTTDLFLMANFEPSIEFGGGKSRDYSFESLAHHFEQNGIQARHPRFDNSPIRIAIVNTLDEPIDDFVEALRRELERKYKLSIDMLRERKVRVISNKNLESAIRVVEKEEPHIIVIFLPDTLTDNLDALDPNFQQIKSLALGKGIASHAIYRKTVHDPDSMSRIIMSIVGKTGNLPYVLSEPLTYADMVVGMDMVRQELSQFDRVTAMARIYDNAGRFFGYIMETVELDSGDPVPFLVMQTLFPDTTFGGKRVIIHRNGDFTAQELTMLKRWGEVIGATFYPVAIQSQRVPHLYSLASKVIGQPDWGSMFVLNALEAFIVTTTTTSDTTPTPLHVSTTADLGIEYGLHSVLMWTLLHYGTLRPSRLPVTVQYAAEMAEWMARGQLPAATAGDVPFWL